MTNNLLKQPLDHKAALKQSIMDDMEIWNILFNQLMENRSINCKGIVKIVNVL